MFDIISFVDSADIREYNKSTVFFPIEQAVLINASRKRPLEEKLSAWHELLETYSEDEFQMTMHGEGPSGDCSYKQMLIDHVISIERALDRRNTAPRIVYEACIYERMYPDNEDLEYFTKYDEAYQYLCNYRQHEYLDDPDLMGVELRAKITAKHLDDPNHCRMEDVFHFDNELCLVDVYVDSSHPDTVGNGLDDIFAYIPLPFKKGDILRTINQDLTFYGVLPRDADEAYFQPQLEHGADNSDMSITLDNYEDGKWWFSHCNMLDLERCSESELPEDQKNLALLSDVYKNKIETGFLLFCLSQYGKEAYKHIYRGESNG